MAHGVPPPNILMFTETMDRGRSRGYSQDTDEEWAVQIVTVEYNT
jgi:hypothetical protein